MSMKWPNKDPNETLDFGVDWSRFLRTDETITSSSWYIVSTENEALDFNPGTSYDTLVNVLSGNDSRVTTITLAGGVSNKQYKLVCRVTLSTDLVAERSVILPIKER